MMPIFRIFSGDISASKVTKGASYSLGDILDDTETGRTTIINRADDPAYFTP